jgi:hypothetical protein
MQDTLFESDIEWHNRRVFICFDKDAGYPTGEYKSGVGRALGRLSAKLLSRGSKVWVMHIPGEVDQKLGLDDYLRAGGTLDTLYSGAVVPPEYCEQLAELLEKCVYVVGTNNTHIYNLENGSRKGVCDFHDAHVEKRRIVPVEGKKPRVEQLSKTWILHNDRQTARHYTLNPRLPFGLSGIDINLWRPYPEFEGEYNAGVERDWGLFMDGLFGEHAKWVSAWIGHMLNRPEEKAHQAVMLTTPVLGIGKGLFSEVVGTLARGHYVECKPEEMLDKFNPAMEGATWVAVHELEVAHSVSEGQINNLITSAEYKIEQKGKDGTYLPDLRRWYMTTNSSTPMRLRRGQRRILVIFPPRTDEDTRGEWAAWVGSRIAGFKRDESALYNVRAWFDWSLRSWEEEHGRWNPTAPVPQTEAADEAAEASMTGNQILVESGIKWVLENGGVGCLMPEHRQLLSKVSGGITAAVRSRGGSTLRHKVSVDGRQVEVVIWDLENVIPSKKLSSGSFGIDTLHYYGEHDFKMLAGQLWAMLRDLKERLAGHGVLKR